MLADELVALEGLPRLSPETIRRVLGEKTRSSRHGTANLFLAFAPLTGQRVVKVTERRCRGDFARFVRDLVDGPYAEAERIAPYCEPCAPWWSKTIRNARSRTSGEKGVLRFVMASSS